MVSENVPADGAAEADRPDDGIPRGRMRRAAPLMALTARTAGEAMAAGLRGQLTGPDAAAFHERTAERYVELLGHSKGALMKVGQTLSLLPNGRVIPAEFRSTYQAALGRLLDEAPPMAPSLAQSVLEQELGRRMLSVFAEFDFEPFAAASIGQVHRARLRDGRAVAVKIQYPGVAEAIRGDLRNQELLATFISLILTVLSPRRIRADVRAVGREMGARITEELDYRLEAAYQAEFARCYRGHPFIRVPYVVGELSTARVLTQELCVGRSYGEAREAKQELRDLWSEALWRFVYYSHAHLGLTNIDIHAGNYLFHDDGSVSFLDFGAIKRYRRDQVDLIIAINRESLRGDVLGTWRLCVEAGFWTASDPVSPQEVFDWWYQPMRHLWDAQPFTITPEYAATWIERRLSLDGPSGNAVRHATIGAEFSAWPRIEVGLASMLAGLRASNDWNALMLECYGEGQPPAAQRR